MKLFFTILSLLTCGVPVSAAEWAVNMSQSEIRFSGTHAGSSFAGVFESWSAKITFDPGAPENARVLVVIDTESATTGNGLYDGTLKGDDWFDAKNHIKAEFQATGFREVAEGQYRVDGTLQIKGYEQPFGFEFELTFDGAEATMEATSVLDRIDFGLGVKSDADAAWVSREIGLQFRVIAREY